MVFNLWCIPISYLCSLYPLSRRTFYEEPQLCSWDVTFLVRVNILIRNVREGFTESFKVLICLRACSNTSTVLDNYEIEMRSLNPTQDRQVDGLFGRVCKIAKVTFSFVISVCLFVCLSIRMEQPGSHWNGLHEIWYLRIFRKSVTQIQVSLKYDKNKGYFIWRLVYI
jgi:hypothetical protein